MANPNPSPKTRFKKGSKAPGWGAMDPEIQRYKKFTQEDVATIGQIIIMGDIPQLEALLSKARHENPAERPTVLQVWIARCAMKAIQEGDSWSLNNLLDRFVGKIPNAVMVSKFRETMVSPEEAKAEAIRLLQEAAADD